MIDKSHLSTGERYGYSLYHLSPIIGTEVRGINLGDKLADEVIVWLSDLLVDRKVIFFVIRQFRSNSMLSLLGDLAISRYTRSQTMMIRILKSFALIMTRLVRQKLINGTPTSLGVRTLRLVLSCVVLKFPKSGETLCLLTWNPPMKV